MQGHYLSAMEILQLFLKGNSPMYLLFNYDEGSPKRQDNVQETDGYGVHFLASFLCLTCFDATRRDLRPEGTGAASAVCRIVGKRQATTPHTNRKDAVKEENQIGFLSRHARRARVLSTGSVTHTKVNVVRMESQFGNQLKPETINARGGLATSFG